MNAIGAGARAVFPTSRAILSRAGRLGRWIMSMDMIDDVPGPD
jgi:hypothetical protein